MAGRDSCMRSPPGCSQITPPALVSLAHLGQQRARSSATKMRDGPANQPVTDKWSTPAPDCPLTAIPFRGSPSMGVSLGLYCP